MSERQQRARRQRAQRQQQTLAQAQRAAGYAQPSLLMAASRQEERFQQFMRQHPEVYAAFKQRAHLLRSRGKRHISAHSICYYLRDETPIDARTGDEAYKINNNWSSRFARLLIAEEPSFAAFIETRQLRSA